MAAPTATYRLQISPAFTLLDAAQVVPQLADLGVSHLYLSPLLTAAPGSTHGYDVVDPTSVDAARGGEPGLRQLADTARAHGLGLVLDVVPNHLSVEVPRANAAWWDVLRHGPGSAYAGWFDIDWAAGPLLLPVLGSDEAVAELSLVDGGVDGHDGPELAYYEHRFPVAPGTAEGDPQQVHDRQHYRLAGWRHGSADLTYRRFFDVSTLAGLRVEDPAVYAATHAKVLELVRDGVVDGLRIDHPDGLAAPGEYLDRLARDTGGAWTVVEKILEPGEALPAGWRTAGTTGYDAARLVTGAFVDPAGEPPLAELWTALTDDRSSFGDVVLAAKREVTRGPLAAEVARLGRLAPEIDPAAIAETLAQFPVYRSYLPGAGLEHLEQALAAARDARPELSFDLLAKRLADAEDPLAIRFQQTSGMVMAKGVEDTAFYRQFVLAALNEVGGDPAAFGVSAAEWHAGCAHLQQHWPAAMTLLSSHDTKRSEDVRARLVLLAELPGRWTTAVEELEQACAPYAGRVSGRDRYLLHQSVVGIGLVDPERLGGYLEKATREAKLATSWLDPDEAYDRDVQALVRDALGDARYRAAVEGLLAELDAPWRRTVQAHKLLQLAMPGVPDVYQGSERTHLALVDPDNRRPVDWGAPAEPKTALVATMLRLRRDRPELFADYQPVPTGTDRALAFTRSPQLLVVVPVRAVALAREGWGDAAVAVPAGGWTDALSGREVAGGGSVPLAELVGDGPGVALVRD